MIHSGAAPPVNHHHHHHPPLRHHPNPPPHRTPSWSTLSPLAPPFTVDRSPTAHPLPSFPPPRAAGGGGQSQPPLSEPFYPSPASEAATNISSSFRSPASSRIVGGAPYYPFYAPDSMEPLPDSRVQGGFGVGGAWNRPFDGDEREGGGGTSSSWMDPSSRPEVSGSKRVTTAEGFVEREDAWGPWRGTLADSIEKKYQFGSECFKLLDDKYPTLPHESFSTPCNFPAESISDMNVLHKRMSYFPSRDPVPMMEEYNTYDSAAPYNKYAAHIVSSSTDPVVYYSEMHSPAQTYAPSAIRRDLSMDCSVETNRYNSIHHSNMYEVNADNEYAYYTPFERKEHSINHDAESKKCFMERSIEGKDMSTGHDTFMESSLAANDFFLLNNLTTGNNKDCFTKDTSGLRVAPLNPPNLFSIECDSAIRDSFVHGSSETLDHLHLTVDSPCWKGAPSTQQFGVAEIVPHPDCFVRQNCLPARTLNTQSSPEQIESSICMEGRNSSFSPVREFSPLDCSVSTRDQCQNARDKGFNCANFENEGGSNSSDATTVQSTVVLKYQKQDLGLKVPFPKQSDLEDSAVSANQSMLACESNLEAGQNSSKHFMDASISGAVLPGDIIQLLTSSEYSSLGKDIESIVKVMHGLSEVLLSMYYGDADKLDEADQVLLQLTLDNLKTLVVKDGKGGIKDTSLASELDAAQSHATVLKPDTATRLSNDWSQDLKGDGSNMCGDKSNISASKDAASIAEALKENLCEHDDDNPHALLYKKLWIEAEAAVCSLKYELKLSQLKLEMGNHKNQTKGSCYNAFSQKEVDSSVNNAQEDASSRQKPQEANTAEANKVEDSVMARLQVLQNRPDIYSGNAEDQQKLADGSSYPSSENCVIQPTKLADFGFVGKGLDSDTEVDTSVMTRFQVLQNRYDKEQHKFAVGCSNPYSENCIGLNPQPTKLADMGLVGKGLDPDSEVDASVMTRFQVLKNRHDKLHSGISENLDVGRSDPDSENFMGLKVQAAELADKVGKGLLDSDEVGASVTTRFQVLKNRHDKLYPGTAECQQNIAVDGSYPNSENYSRLNDYPMKSDLGFMGKGVDPDSKIVPGGRSTSSKAISDSLLLGGNFNEENGLFFRNSEHGITGLSGLCVTDDQLIQSYIPNWKGKRIVSDGYNFSPSSEWEHVQEEEFTWYNNP